MNYEQKFIDKARRMGYRPLEMTYEEACKVEQALIKEERQIKALNEGYDCW